MDYVRDYDSHKTAENIAIAMLLAVVDQQSDNDAALLAMTMEEECLRTRNAGGLHPLDVFAVTHFLEALRSEIGVWANRLLFRSKTRADLEEHIENMLMPDSRPWWYRWWDKCYCSVNAVALLEDLASRLGV